MWLQDARQSGRDARVMPRRQRVNRLAFNIGSSKGRAAHGDAQEHLFAPAALIRTQLPYGGLGLGSTLEGLGGARGCI